MEIALSDARAALAEAAGKAATLLSSAGDGRAAVRGSDWTVGEVGAHLVVALMGFTESARGSPDGIVAHVPAVEAFSPRLTAFTASTLAVVPERDPATLAPRLRTGAEEFLDATVGRAGDEPIPMPWYGPGVTLPTAVATTMLVGESLLHGWDVARTLGRPWPIDADHARLLARAVTWMIPLALDPQAAAGLRVAFDVAVRGGPRFVVHVRDAAATVAAAGPEPVDCRLFADPVALVLLAYGRVDQWRLIARGKLLAAGRRPWLALRFKGLFVNP